jgi:diacylglycerol kinase (ATP)
VNVLLVHKPSAGDQKHDGDDIARAVTAAGHRVAYFTTDDAWQCGLDGTDLVVAAGGDGTVSAVFSAIVQRDVATSVMPLGTANNIAKTLGIDADDPFAVIYSWPQWFIRRFDVPTVEISTQRGLFVERVGGGLFSDLLEAAARHSNRGVDVSVDGALQLFRRVLDTVESQPWSVTVDRRDFSGEYVGVEVMNICHTGPNVALVEAADFGDGLLDVVLIGAEQCSLLRHHVDQRLAGHTTLPPLELPTVRGRTVALASLDAQLHIDDRLAEHSEKMSASSGDGHVMVLAPARDVAATRR